MKNDLKKVRRVRKENAARLMAMANVVGVGVGYRRQAGVQTDELALVVMVSRKVPHTLLLPEDLLPTEIDGVPVDVQEVGAIQAQV